MDTAHMVALEGGTYAALFTAEANGDITFNAHEWTVGNVEMTLWLEATTDGGVTEQLPVYMRFLRTPRAPYVPGLNRTYFWQVGTDSEEIERMLLRPGAGERYVMLSPRAAVDPMGGSVHIRSTFFLGNATARDRTAVPDWLGITIEQAPPMFELKIDKTKLSHAATGLHGITVTVASDYEPEVFGDSRGAWGLSAPATAYRTLLNVTYRDIPKQEEVAKEVKKETKVATRKQVLTGEPVEAYLESISAQGLLTIGFN